jgi:hypothetical protein
MKNIYKSIKVLSLAFLLASGSTKAQTYCTAAAISTADEEIFNVTFATLNNSSNCSTTGGAGSTLNLYSNYTALTAPIVIQGFSYPLSMVVGQCGSFAYSGYVGVWIDYNQNFVFTDPGEQVFMSGLTTFAIAGATVTAPSVTVPVSALLGVTRMRVIAMESGIPGPCTSPTWGEVEDYNIQIISATPCSAVPGANSINGPTASICPNAVANMALATNYTVAGISYQWLSSTTSSVGPFTAVPGATNANYSAPNLTVSTWFTLEAVCANASGTTVATGTQVVVAGTTTNSVPYFEGFEGIGVANELPNCSWVASNLPTNCQTYVSSNTLGRTPRTGSKFASFFWNPGGTRYFYTNGIQLEAGITYSASLWYQTEYFGYNNWSDLSILYGTTQTPTGLTSVASTNGPAIATIYKQLANTFTVATSGLYYFAIRATGSTASSAQYLTWDDLSITIPCTPASGNSPTITVSASSNTICEGQSVNITANGANTYTWSNGSNTNVLTETPLMNTTYNVVGTNSLTGCTQTVVQTIAVSPSPIVFIISNNATVCAGSPAMLTALGALTYTWNNGSMTNVTTVSPLVATTYTVLASNALGCSSQATQLVGVNALPNAAVATSAPIEMCVGETVNLTGTGAVSYQWLSSSSSIVYQGSPISVSPNVTTTYTMTGTDANGCSKSVTLVQTVNECVGINQITAASNIISVFPNPTNGDITIETRNNSYKVVEVVDLSGRVIASNGSADETIIMSMSAFANGIYYVKIQTNTSTEVVKIVKN